MKIIGFTGSPDYLNAGTGEKRNWDMSSVTVHCGRCGKASYELLVNYYTCELFESLGQPCIHYNEIEYTIEMDADSPCNGCRIIHEVVNRYGLCTCSSDEFSRWMAHLEHGRGTADDGPVDSDCACRATHREADCAAEGCGFCRAASVTIAEKIASGEPCPICKADPERLTHMHPGDR